MSARRVGFVAPSGYLPEKDVAAQAASFFEARGWQVEQGRTVSERHLRFAGPDDLRLAELQRFAIDRSLDVVVAARGGYGLSRLLDRIDFASIGAAGRVLVGYSDFTAFGLALLARAGAVSFQGPAASDFALASQRDFTISRFFEAIEQPRVALEFDADGPALEEQGPLWGGNLSMLCALIGTPYLPQVQGGILFLEDVNEPAYRVERMMLQLLQAGIWGRQRAVVLGDFLPMPAMPNDNGYGLASVVEHMRTVSGTPIVSGLPFGHGARRATLPIGAAGRLSVHGACARLQFEGHPILR